MADKWWRRIEVVWLITFTAALILAWQANNNRISDIQNSRRQSCQQTYKGIRQVFQPFIIKNPTNRQKADRKKFEDTITHLINNCSDQTKSSR